MSIVPLMTLWILIAVMTAVAALSILVPMSRKRLHDGEAAGPTADEAVYRQQLDEVDKDLERGLIDDEAAGAARTEIARRLLAAHERAEKVEAAPKASWPLRFGQIVAIVCLPLLVLLAFALPPYRRHQVVAGGSIVLQLQDELCPQLLVFFQ